MIFFDWDDKRWKSKKGSQLFEELCFDLLRAMGFKDVNWRKGSSDEGRDITCHSEVDLPDDTVKKEEWFCGCKYSGKSLNKNSFRNERDWADVDRPSYLLIITQSYLTPQTKQWIEKFNFQSDRKYQIKYWEKADLEQQIEQCQNKLNMVKFFPSKGIEQLIQRVREENIKSEERYYADVQRIKTQIATLKPEEDATKMAQKYEHLAKLAEDANKPYQASDFLNDVLRISKKTNDKTKLFEIRKRLGELHLLKGWEWAAQREFDKALVLANELGNKRLIAKINFALGKAFHFESVYHNAKEHYEKAIDLFREIGILEEEILSKIFSAKLSLDLDIWQDYQKHIDNFERIISTKPRLKNKELAIRLHQTLARLYSRKRLWDKANAAIQNAKRSFTKGKLDNKRLLLRLLFDEAFLYYLQDQSDRAIQVLEEECFEIAKRLRDEQEIMLVLRQASFVRMYRNKLSLGSVEDWEAQSRANDIRRKFETEFDRAQREESYAGWGLVNNKFRDSLISLNQSKRIYSNLGDFVDALSVTRELATLNELAGQLLDALDYSIDLGEADRIRRICERLVASTPDNQIKTIFDMLLELQNISATQRVGLAAALEGLSSIVPDDYVEKVTLKLIELSRDQLSMVSNYDVRRTALKALQHYSDKVDGEVLELLVKRLEELFAPDNHWDVRSKSLEVCRGFYGKLPEKMQQDLTITFDRLLENEKEDSHLSHEIVIAAANFSLNFDSPWKEKLLEALKKKWNQKLTLEGVRILSILGVSIPEITLRKAITNLIGIVEKQVIIEDKPSPSEATPSMPGSIFVQTSPLGPNKRVVVGGGYDLSLFGIVADKIPSDLREAVTRSVLDQIRNEYNMIINKQTMVGELSILKRVIPLNQMSEVVDLLSKLAQGELFISKGQSEQLANNENPFSTDNLNFGKPEDLIGEAIETLGELLDVLDSDQKARVINIFVEQSSSNFKKARKAVAYSLRYLTSFSTTEKLTLFSLLKDSHLDVVAVATPTFGLVYGKIDDEDFKKYVINRICTQIEISHPYLRLTSATAFGEFLKKGSLDDSTKRKVMNGLSRLANDRYYKVRRHAQKILSAIN